MVRERMGKLLLEAGLVSEEQLNAALHQQREKRNRLGSTLVAMGILSEACLVDFLSQQYGVPSLEEFPPHLDPSLAEILPLHIAQLRMVVPVKRIGSCLTVAMVDPSEISVMDELAFQTGLQILPVVASERGIMNGMRQLYGPAERWSSPPAQGLTDFHEPMTSVCDARQPENGHDPLSPSLYSLLQAEEFSRLVEDAVSSVTGKESAGAADPLAPAPMVELVNTLLARAVFAGVSDIHFEPFETTVRVRFRLDGVLYPVMTYSPVLRNAVISRLKILSNLDIAERRLPQDGRFTFEDPNKGRLDVRVSILPCFHGEKAVLRILDRSGCALDLSALGFDPDDLDALLAAMNQPEGMILVTGPTGSGKTTTLYSALQLLNTPGINIVTVEDPVEYRFMGINQVQVREEIGLGFAEVLRAVLRQDPDVLMVGEIRDHHTAQIAVKAALTGHRVLTTLHTPDAIRTVTRLMDMGVEPFLVAASVRVILAQRLVRRICPHCLVPDPQPVPQLEVLGFSSEEAGIVQPMRGKGCAACHGTGYKGRMAVCEVLRVDEPLQRLILQGASPEHLIQTARQMGFSTLRHNGLKKIQAGLTTVEEIMKTTSWVGNEHE